MKFLPVRLLILNIRFFTLGIVMWGLLILIALGEAGGGLGIPALFWYPETTNYSLKFACFIVGFSVGGFLLYYNISFYGIAFQHLPFFLTVKRPFLVFSLNNFFVPLSLIIVICLKMVFHQVNDEGLRWAEAIENCAFFVCGVMVFAGIGGILLNISIRNKTQERHYSNIIVAPVEGIFSQKRTELRSIVFGDLLYITPQLSIRRGRIPLHYSKELINAIISKHKLNVTILDILLLLTAIVFVLLATFSGIVVPAASSIVFLATLIVWLSAILKIWMKEWGLPLLVLIGVIYFHIRERSFKDYFLPSSPYKMNDSTDIVGLKNEARKIFYGWKKKRKSDELFIVCASGGGLRATLWSYAVNSYLDSMTSGEYRKKLFMYCGISGGALAYLWLAHSWKQDSIPSLNAIPHFSSDMLNVIVWFLIANDLLIPLKYYEYGGIRVPINRGTAFENLLKEKTGESTLTLNSLLENEKLPFFTTMLATSKWKDVIVVSSFPCKFGDYDWLWIAPSPSVNSPSYDFFRIIRASTSVPFIMPDLYLNVNLPVRVIDGGFIDNYGVLACLRFLIDYENELLNIFSKIHVIIIRPQNSLETGDEAELTSFLFLSQRQNQKAFIDYISRHSSNKISFYFVELPMKKTYIPLTWQLTNKEKNLIVNSLFEQDSQNVLSKLIREIKD